MKSKWTLIEYIGHRYYRDNAGRIAVADDSIRYPGRPETTDDGLLLLDTSRAITRTSRGNPMIPLIAPDGSQSSTPATEAEARFAATHFPHSRAPDSVPNTRVIPLCAG